MKFVLLRCCTTPIFLKHYETSVDAVLERLGIEVVGDEEFNCCGYPLRNFSPGAYLLASARDLALAEKKGMNILTACSCCYGSLKRAGHTLDQNPALKEHVNETLARDGLSYGGRVEAKHLLQVLHDDIGPETIQGMVEEKMKGVRVAVHYGCHLLRPNESVAFDNPFSPVKFDRLVEATGARSIPWPSKLDCCGSPLLGTNDELSMDLTATKLANARKAGADLLCVICPLCQIQFDRVQKMMLQQGSIQDYLPSILFTQLLGLSLGIDEERLGLDKGLLPTCGVEHLNLFAPAKPVGGPSASAR